MHVDMDALRSILEERMGSPVTITRSLGSGVWSTAYEFVTDASRLVARISKQSSHFEKDRYAHRWSSSSLPIPDVIVLHEYGGLWCSVSTFAEGDPLQLLAPEHGQRAAPALVSCLIEIGRSDLSGTTGWGRWDGAGRAPATSWRDFLLAIGTDPFENGDMTWRTNIDNRGPAAVDVFDDAYRELERLDVEDPPRALVHADLVNGNVHIRDRSVGGVFDWGQALFGDPVYDAAFLDFVSPAYPALRLADTTQALREIYVPTRDRLRACHLHHGLLLLAVNAQRQDWTMFSAVRDRLAALEVVRSAEHH
jgi:hygromycin-B 4-O-kinase